MSQEKINSILRYDKKTGKLFWKSRPVSDFKSGKKRSDSHVCNLWNSNNAGNEINCLSNYGYNRVNINYVAIAVHRVIWFMVKGYWPLAIDHINHDRSDNRWCNLREVSKIENSRNQSLRKTNKSGVSGVYRSKNKKRWVAEISKKYLGTYDSFGEAVEVRKTAEIDLGFHKNHGVS